MKTKEEIANIIEELKVLYPGAECSLEFNPEKAYGYKTCKSTEDFQTAISELYVTKVIPAIERGLCAAIITQVSDVEDEINGMLTYDRRMNKADAQLMTQLSQALQEAFAENCKAPSLQD